MPSSAMGRKAGIRRKRQKKPGSLSTMWKIRKRQLQCWNGWSGLLLKGSHGMEVYSLIDTVFRKGAKTC